MVTYEKFIATWYYDSRTGERIIDNVFWLDDLTKAQLMAAINDDSKLCEISRVVRMIELRSRIQQSTIGLFSIDDDSVDEEMRCETC